MGEVYRATDTNLGREVAIKVLPEAFAQDPDRVARFEREAKTFASLNHPNIAIIHGLDKSQGTYALVMELVEGEDLSQRIARGPIPIDEALPIAKQIAEALQAAHEQGVIHRDLKPANIKITPNGDVKVLDFGLAKLADGASVGSTSAQTSPLLSLSPTITSPALMTNVGVLLGTAPYMAPEQAKGRPADKRSDVWAFGCVLYEMLTGKRAFEGEDVTETLAAILMREPNWSALPSTTPATVRAILKGCLDKNRRERFGDISTPRFLLSERSVALIDAGSWLGNAGDMATLAAVPNHLARRMRSRLLLVAIVALVVGSSVAAVAMWLTLRPPVPRQVRFTINTAPQAPLTLSGADRDIAITPDGSRVVYVGNGGNELFVRRIDALDPVSIFKGRPRGPFVSPDGHWIGFFDDQSLKKVAADGGPPITLVADLRAASRGGTWTPDDRIIFATSATPTALQQVSAAGGAVTTVATPRNGNEVNYMWPELLPNGRVNFTIVPVDGGVDAAQIAVFDQQTHAIKTVILGGSDAHYVQTGHLIYAASTTLRAVAFDQNTLEVRGVPVPVVADVVNTLAVPAGGVDAVVAADGTLAFVRGKGVVGGLRTLVWVDRDGRETAIAAPPRAYGYPRITPDGRRVVVRANDRQRDLWAWDFTRLTLTRLTFTSGIDNYPVLTPDGRRVVFASEIENAQNLFWQAADGSGDAERLTRSRNDQTPTGISPDGARLVFTEIAPGAGSDVMQLTLVGNRNVIPLIQSSFDERNGIVSPDGRWIAYEGNDSGRFEIYVRPYADPRNARWQVSTGGGTRPLWSPKGDELFYVSSTGAVMRVGVGRGPSWDATTPELVVKEGYATIIGGFFGRNYDVSSDGERFLMLKQTDDPTVPPPQFVVVQHFDQELKRLVPTK
jgi:eukaryotic-like serine/threonine-protein kinase